MTAVEQTKVAETSTVTVYDPLNRRPYQLKKSDLHFTVGMKNLWTYQGNTKRLFLCKNYQTNECKAQKRCNNIHVKREVVAELRAQYPVTEEDLASGILLNTKDPVSGMEFRVPKDRTAKTVGQERTANGTVPMCVDHDQKGCALDEQCPFLHIDAAYMRHVRILWQVPCCMQCTSTTTSFPLLKGDQEWDRFVVANRTSALSRSHLSMTKGLRELCRVASSADGVLFVPLARVCRPHQRSACKWGAECSNVHVCRKKFGVFRERTPSPSGSPPVAIPVSAPAAASPVSSPATVPVSVSAPSPTVSQPVMATPVIPSAVATVIPTMAPAVEYLPLARPPVQSIVMFAPLATAVSTPCAQLPLLTKILPEFDGRPSLIPCP